MNSNTAKNGSPNKLDAEAYLNHMGRQSLRIDAERKVLERIPRQRKQLNTPKTGPPKSDVEAYIDDWKHATIRQQRESQERDRVSHQRTILFPNSVPKEDVKPQSSPYKIPQRKPVPKSNDTTPQRPPPPQGVLLRNGETKRVENRATYAERIRELGYPEALCPLPMTNVAAGNNGGGECIGAKGGREEGRRHDSIHAQRNSALTPEMLTLSREFLTLKPGQKRV